MTSHLPWIFYITENEIVCPNLSPPLNGSVVFTTSIEDKAVYSCNSGLILVGEAESTCQPNGEWSGESEPICGLPCHNLMNPENGMVTLLAGTDPTSPACYSCSDGFVLSELFPCRTCMLDGMWSGPEITCDRRKYCTQFFLIYSPALMLAPTPSLLLYHT